MKTPSRELALEALKRDVFDLLVIGGGITGARVAYDAAAAGMRVALVDAGDFGGATSGASAGLVHGGLRYLRTGGIGLIRTAQRERRALSTRIAPHVRPRGLTLRSDPLPGARSTPAGRLESRLGATVADHLLRLHGGEAVKLLDYAATFPDALEKISASAPDIWAQVYHAVREEWALTVDDVVRRRTTLGIRGLDTPSVRARISGVLESHGRGLHPVISEARSLENLRGT